MKILHTVQRYFPDSGGSEEVVRQLSEHLVSFGHEVTVLTGATENRNFHQLNGVTIKDFPCSGNSVEGIRGDAREFQDFLEKADADILMNYAAQIWSSDLAFDVLSVIPAKKVFVPCGYSRLHDPLFSKYFAAMPEILRRYDRVIYLSENYIDKEFAWRHGVTNGVVIPNGADAREFAQGVRGKCRRRFGLKDKTIILNVSNHSLLKNHEFFWNCVRKTGSDRTGFLLVGNAFAQGAKKWVKECYARCRANGLRYHVPVLEGCAREEVVEAFLDADIFLFGSKVECSPLVMFESFASKTLFVSTDCGNVGDYRDVACIVKDEQEAVDVIQRYHSDPSQFQGRIEKGYTLIQQQLNWGAIARQYERLYMELLNNNMGAHP